MKRLQLLRSRKAAILELTAKYGVRRIRLFGSAARGEELPDSDVDFLVEFEPGRSLLDQVGLEQALAALLDCRVDVAVEGGLSPYLEQRILQEAVPL